MLFIKIHLNCFFASSALLKVRFLFAFVDLMEVISADFNDLSACNTIGEHLALENVVQIKLLTIDISVTLPGSL